MYPLKKPSKPKAGVIQNLTVASESGTDLKVCTSFGGMVHLVPSVIISHLPFRNIFNFPLISSKSSCNFKDRFGISPKQYLKLLRFEKAIKALSSGKEMNIFEIALRFGYYDHAHFTNEFKLFMGVTSREYQNNILNKGVIVN